MKILKIFCLVLVILFSGFWAFAGIFIENFDSGKDKDWTIINGKWEVVKGAYMETAGTTYAKTMFGDINWTDYTVEVDITIKAAGAQPCAGILVRADEEGENGFRFWIRTDMAPQLSKWVNNLFEHIKIDIPIKIEEGKTYRLKAILNGNKHEYYIDKDLAVEYNDKDEFSKSGRIGFICHLSNPAYDNLIISGPGIPSSSVEARNKLATTWAYIRSR